MGSGWMGRDLAHLNGKGHRELGTRMARWIESRYDLWLNASSADREEWGPFP